MIWTTALCIIIVDCRHQNGSETWPVNAEMTQLINSFATSASRIMTGVKRLDKVRNSVVLDSVSRSDLIHTFLSRQLRFLGHQLRSDHALYAIYEPTRGKTRRGRPRTNYITFIQKITIWTYRDSAEPGRLASACGEVCHTTWCRRRRMIVVIIVNERNNGIDWQTEESVKAVTVFGLLCTRMVRRLS